MEERVIGGRYRIIGRLGQGGMATVFRAVDELLGREVAVKEFRIGPVDHGERARAEAEIQVLAALRSPSLVTLYDAGIGDDDGDWFLVMELVPGSDLTSRLAEGPLDPVTTARVGAQIAEGLAAAHAKGIVHRDVKPANVLLESDGTHVKLADFGIALLRDSARVTGTGLVMGTAAYLAPEQVLGQEITGKTDVYALGLVLLECMTGRQAYPGSAIESATARLTREPQIDQNLPVAWRTLLHTMLASDPAERPTAAEAATRLQALGRGEVTSETRLLPQGLGAAAAAAAGAAAAATGATSAQADELGATRKLPAANAQDDTPTTRLPGGTSGTAATVANPATTSGASGGSGSGNSGSGGGRGGSGKDKTPRPGHRRLWLIVVIIVAVLVVAGVVIALVMGRNSGGTSPTKSSTPSEVTTSAPSDTTDTTEAPAVPSTGASEDTEPTTPTDSDSDDDSDDSGDSGSSSSPSVTTEPSTGTTSTPVPTTVPSSTAAPTSAAG